MQRVPFVPMPVARPAPVPAAATGPAIERHLRALWRHLRMYGCDAATADDLAQQVFVIAVEKGALAFEPAATTAFLHRTARFVFLRHVRDRAGARELADAADELWARDCGIDGGDARLEALRACVAQLDARARAAVAACYGDGADAAGRRDAAAHQLGLRPNGLKTLLQRVRQQLRVCIERRLA